MDFVLWIAAAWFGISVAAALALATFIRDSRGAGRPSSARANLSRPDRAESLR